jgi:hypothetical protein
MHDSLRVSRLTLGHFRIVANRLPSELRGAYALLPDDDLITEGAHYQSWLTVANLAGELRFDYLVRSEQPRALLGEEALRALARTLAVSNVARVSADRARSHAAASVGAVGVLVVALALAARVGARPAARRAFKRRGEAHIPSASRAYTKKVLSL